MTSGESTRISAAVGMQLNNQRIGKRMNPPKASTLSGTIRDTLETSDGDSGNSIRRNADSGLVTDEHEGNDSVLPGDVLDISG